MMENIDFENLNLKELSLNQLKDLELTVKDDALINEIIDEKMSRIPGMKDGSESNTSNLESSDEAL